MPARSQLILPPRHIASCVVGCIVRDTRGVDLSDADRVNYFPALPLFTITLTLTGQIHTADRILPYADLRNRPAAPPRLFQPPYSAPQMSWSPGPIHAMTIAFFPDAWQRLGGAADGTPPLSIQNALATFETGHLETAWPLFWQDMATIWAASKVRDGPADWAGSDRLRDWAHHLTGQLAQTGVGRGLRSTQRRLRRWTGLDKQTLDFFTKVEDVQRLLAADPDTTPADLAIEAGYADQSHMGRALKRATGFSPVTLNQKIATEEPFWCYRLLGERF